MLLAAHQWPAAAGQAVTDAWLAIWSLPAGVAFDVLAVFVLCSVFLTVLFNRIPVGVDAIRERGQLFREVDGGLIENVYTLKIRNMGEKEMSYRIAVGGLEGARIVGPAKVTIKSGDVLALPVAVQVPRSALQGISNADVVFSVAAVGQSGIRDTADSRFLGPEPAR